MKLQSPNQIIQLEAHGSRAVQFLQLAYGLSRPSLVLSWEFNSFISEQRFDSAFGGRHLAYVCVSQLNQMPQLAVSRRGYMNALQITSTELSGEILTVEP